MASHPATKPLSELLAAPVTKEDLEDHDGVEYEEEFLTKFEEAWAQYLSKEQHPLTMGAKHESILQLREEASELEESKESVELELKKQVDFLHSSVQALEELFASKMQEAMEKQVSIHEELSRKIESVRRCDKLQQQTLPWQHFLEELDRLVEEQETRHDDGVSEEEDEKKNHVDHHARKKTKEPSARAILLLGQSSGSQSDQQLRAQHIDYALLTAHVAMLKRDIERYERQTAQQEEVGKFLTEHNVWSILKTSTATPTASTTTREEDH